MPSDNSLRRYTELPYLIDYLATNEIFLPSPKSWDDRNDSYYIEQYAKLNNYSDVFALCLTEAPETYHHWKVFSSGSSGVCIVFNREKFDREILKINDLQARTVDYKTIEQMRSEQIKLNDLPFLKRFPYRDEKEYRLFSVRKGSIKQGTRINISKTAIERVTLSPWLTKTVAKHVKSTIKSIDGCSKLRVYSSTLIDNENWKKFSSKVY